MQSVTDDDDADDDDGGGLLSVRQRPPASLLVAGVMELCVCALRAPPDASQSNTHLPWLLDCRTCEVTALIFPAGNGSDGLHWICFCPTDPNLCVCGSPSEKKRCSRVNG